MRYFALSSIVAALAVAGCAQEPSAPVQLETIPLRATVTPDNHCTVEAYGKTYTSVGQVRGAFLPTFTGTENNAGLHAIGCWVNTSDGSDGDLVVIFTGNSYQLPFSTGTFQPRFEPPYGTDDKIASVSFRASSHPNEKLVTIDQSTGTVTVDAAPNGARTIHLDVTAYQYPI